MVVKVGINKLSLKCLKYEEVFNTAQLNITL
jgi:hypothetical protein